MSEVTGRSFVQLAHALMDQREFLGGLYQEYARTRHPAARHAIDEARAHHIELYDEIQARFGDGVGAA